MSSYRIVAQWVLTLMAALSLGGCLMDSGSGGSWFEDGSRSASGVSLVINSPTTAPSMDTTDATVTLGGTADSDFGITQVSWRNDQGGQGTANGTSAWQTSAIALDLGENTIIVTAEDSEGNTHTRNLVVNRESGETGSATLSWTAPGFRTDGSPLDNLAGYTIYYGRMSGVYDYTIDVSNPGVLSYVVENLVSGRWYFALAAYDADGIESDRSNEVTRTIS